MSVRLRHDAPDPELEARVREVLAGLEKRPIPLGSFRRLMSLGGLQASLFGHYTLSRLREVFHGAEAAERLRAEAHAHAALQVLSRMGYLRGLVLKIGQVLASYPTLVPSEWARVLACLQWEAPPMHYSLVRDQLVAELGAAPEEVFAEFEHRAFAAASLGQVHRARLTSGEAVAVKIQYPGIARTIQVDLANLRTLLQPLRLVVHWDELMSLFDDLAAALARESDYHCEADFQDRAREAFAGADVLHVPRVHPELSTSRVLVTELREGWHLDDVMRDEVPQELRNRFGAALWEGQARLNLGARLIYPDANAGNFLFHEDGSVTFLDFGNMRELKGEDWEFYAAAMAAASSFEIEALENSLTLGTTFAEGDIPEDFWEQAKDFARWSSAPYMEDRVFHYDEAYWRWGLDHAVGSFRRGYTQILPVLGHICRAAYGAAAIMTRLGCRVNVHQVMRRLFEEYEIRPPRG